VLQGDWLIRGNDVLLEMPITKFDFIAHPVPVSRSNSSLSGDPACTSIYGDYSPAFRGTSLALQCALQSAWL